MACTRRDNNLSRRHRRHRYRRRSRPRPETDMRRHVCHLAARDLHGRQQGAVGARREQRRNNTERRFEVRQQYRISGEHEALL